MPRPSDFFNIVDLSREFNDKGAAADRSYFNSSSLLAQAQQLSVISGRLEELQAHFDGIGKSLRSVAVSLEKIVKAIDIEKGESDGKEAKV